MTVLFISSGNSKYGIIPFIKTQGDSLKDLGIAVEYFLVKGKGFQGYLKNVFRLRNSLKTNRIDILHAHYSLTAFMVSLSAIGKSKPLVVSLMGSDIQSGIIERLLIKTFNYLFWNKLIVKSESMAEKIGIKKVHIIPNGVNLNQVSAKPQSEMNKQKIVLFAADPGRKSKNFQLAQEAFDMIEAKMARIEVVFNLPHSELISKIYHADIVLSTSLWEGSPNLIKEAMAASKPIVSTNVGDVAWLFGDLEGCYLTTFDKADVAEKLLQAIKFCNTKKQTSGRERIKHLGLDTRSVALKLQHLYSDLLQ